MLNSFRYSQTPPLVTSPITRIIEIAEGDALLTAARVLDPIDVSGANCILVGIGTNKVVDEVVDTDGDTYTLLRAEIGMHVYIATGITDSVNKAITVNLVSPGTLFVCAVAYSNVNQLTPYYDDGAHTSMQTAEVIVTPTSDDDAIISMCALALVTWGADQVEVVAIDFFGMVGIGASEELLAGALADTQQAVYVAGNSAASLVSFALKNG